jgi:EamA domain-containing membrane protein RarD
MHDGISGAICCFCAFGNLWLQGEWINKIKKIEMLKFVGTWGYFCMDVVAVLP